MNIRIMGLPAETEKAITAITAANGIEVIEVSQPRSNRGDSRMVRVYLEVRLRDDRTGETP
jgi:hypothetical protein